MNIQEDSTSASARVTSVMTRRQPLHIRSEWKHASSRGEEIPQQDVQIKSASLIGFYHELVKSGNIDSIAGV